MSIRLLGEVSLGREVGAGHAPVLPSLTGEERTPGFLYKPLIFNRDLPLHSAKVRRRIKIALLVFQ